MAGVTRHAQAMAKSNRPEPEEPDDTEPVSLRLRREMIAKIDAWAKRKSREDGAEWSRSNAIRVLLTQALDQAAS